MDGDTQVYLLSAEAKSDEYGHHVRQTGSTLIDGKTEILGGKLTAHLKNSSSGDQSVLSEAMTETKEPVESLDFLAHSDLLSPSTKSSASVPSFTHLSLDDPGSTIDLQIYDQQSPTSAWPTLGNDGIRWQKSQSSWSLSMSTTTTGSDSTWSSYVPLSRSSHFIPRLHNTQATVLSSPFRMLRSQSESSVIESSNQLLWQPSAKYNDMIKPTVHSSITEVDNSDVAMTLLSDLSDYSADSPSEATSPYRPPVLLGMGTKEEEEDPNTELPMMSTILERMPWHPDRAREFLHHYLNLAQQKGDHYKVQKLKQQLKYLTIRNKKRSYRNIANTENNNNNQENSSNNRWNSDRKKRQGAQNQKANENWNSDQKNNSETWWRSGMKCNTRPPSPQWECPTPALPPYRMPPPLWNSIIPRPIMRLPPFRPATQYCFRPLPIPPVAPPDPEWGLYPPAWLRPQPPLWNAYQPGYNNTWNPGKRIRSLGHAGGDIYGNRQERRWSPQNRKSGKF